MTDSSRFADYPDAVNHGTTNPGIVYRRVPGRYATAAEVDAVDALGSLVDDEGTELTLASGEPPSDEDVLPVYAIEDGGAAAVPTGLVFVRFSGDVEATTREAELAEAGYAIARTISYAPNAIWVRASSGDAAHSLENIDALEAVGDVENVEPQFLSEVHRRPGM